MGAQSLLLEKLRLYFETPRGDVEHAADLYHDDAALEFPQSGERFDGRETFTEWRSRYPAAVGYRLRRVTVRDDLVVVELSATYDDGPPCSAWHCWSSGATRSRASAST